MRRVKAPTPVLDLSRVVTATCELFAVKVYCLVNTKSLNDSKNSPFLCLQRHQEKNF